MPILKRVVQKGKRKVVNYKKKHMSEQVAKKEKRKSRDVREKSQERPKYAREEKNEKGQAPGSVGGERRSSCCLNVSENDRLIERVDRNT